MTRASREEKIKPRKRWQKPLSCALQAQIPSTAAGKISSFIRAPISVRSAVSAANSPDRRWIIVDRERGQPHQTLRAAESMFTDKPGSVVDSCPVPA